MSILVPFHPLSTRSSYDRETRTLAGPKCPSGHTCKPKTFRDEHTCDGCGVDIDPAEKGARCTMCDFDLCIECTATAAVVSARVTRATGLPNPPSQPQPLPEFDSIAVSDLAQNHDRHAAEPVSLVPSALMHLPGYHRLPAQPQFVHPLESLSTSDIAPNFTVRNPSRLKLKPKPSSHQPLPEFDSIADSELAQTLSLPSPDCTAVDLVAPVPALNVSPGYHRAQAQPQLLHPLNSISASDIAPNFAVPNPCRMKLKPKPASHLHARERDAQLGNDCHVLPLLIVLIPTKHPIVCDNFFWC